MDGPAEAAETGAGIAGAPAAVRTGAGASAADFRLMPSGVFSKAQAIISAIGKPTPSKTITSVAVQSGRRSGSAILFTT